MLSKLGLSVFSKPWTDGSTEVLIRGGIALITLGTTGYILHKVLNSTAVNSFGATSRSNDTTENPVYSNAVQEHLQATYGHFAGGLIMTVGFAYIFHRSGLSMKLITTNKWVTLTGMLFLNIVSVCATKLIDQRKNPVSKYTAWALFNSSFGLILSPLWYLESSLLARAAALSTSVAVSISIVGMTARRAQYLWLTAPLMAGLSVVAVASVLSTILPDSASRALSMSEFISLYGGLAVFAGVLLVDTQKIIDNAENARDPATLSCIDESLDIYLDTINIFIRILKILIEYENSKNKKANSTKKAK